MSDRTQNLLVENVQANSNMKIYTNQTKWPLISKPPNWVAIGQALRPTLVPRIRVQTRILPQIK